MRFTSPFLGLVALATICIASPHANVQVLVNDFGSLTAVAARLEVHIQHFDVMNMIQDKKAIINGFEQIIRDATAIPHLTSPEATQVLSAESNLAHEIHRLTGIVIGHKNDIPAALHGAIRNDLLTIAQYAEEMGRAVIHDCPPDKRSEAIMMNSGIAGDLNTAAQAFA